MSGDVTSQAGSVEHDDAGRIEYAPHRFVGRAYAEANGLVAYRRPEAPAGTSDDRPAKAKPKKRPLAAILAEADRGFRRKRGTR